MFYLIHISNCFIIHSISLRLVHYLPLDIALQKSKYAVAKIFITFIQNWFTENLPRKDFHTNSIKSNFSDVSFHQVDAAHHFQNHDQFDEENDS